VVQGQDAKQDLKQELKPDICVIGATAGGLAAATAAAAFGVPVVLVTHCRIEEGRIGDDRLNGVAVPAKALSEIAGRVHALRDGARSGIKAVRFGVDFAGVNARVHEVVRAAAPKNTRERFAGLGIRVIEGAARFANSRTVQAGDTTIAARRFILATGSQPAVPAIPGLAEVPHVTAENVFTLADCPRHLIVIGAGSTGLELAQAFRRLGAEVTVLEKATPLAPDDAECAAIVLDALESEGIRLRTGVTVARVRRSLARVQVDIATPDGTETVEGTHLLVATGRQPNVDGLDLDAARIRVEPHRVVVDKRLRTRNRRVYAIGDVAGGSPAAHVAEYEAGLVVRNALFRMPVPADRSGIPAVTYTDPELAQVGLNEDDARARVGIIRVLRWPYAENDRAQAAAATKGHIKVVTDRRGHILGATLVGPEAGESVALWALAIGQKLDIGAMAGLPAPYPSYAEVGKRAAMTYFMRGLTSSRVRRIIGWLRRLG